MGRVAIVVFVGSTVACGGAPFPLYGAGDSGDAGADDSPGAGDAPEASPDTDAIAVASPGTDASDDTGPEPDATVAPVRTPTWTAVSARIVEGDIVSVWGTGPDDLYVGTDLKTVYTLKNGYSTWTGLATDVVGGGWGSDPANVYAVGASAWLAQAGIVSSGGLFRYRGNAAWTPVATGIFYAVWGSSPTDLYVAGEMGVAHAVAGGAFTTELADAGSALSIWGSSAGDVYVTTSSPVGTIMHSAGDGVWQGVYAEATGRAWVVWGSGPGDVYAVLSPVSASDPTAHLVHSMPDGSWASEPVSSTPTTLVALWGSGPHDVYAGGWHSGGAGKTGDLFHSAGDGRWTPVSLPGKPYDVRCIWGTSPSDVYVGVFDVNDGPVLLHGPG